MYTNMLRKKAPPMLKRSREKGEWLGKNVANLNSLASLAGCHAGCGQFKPQARVPFDCVVRWCLSSSLAWLAS